jgi:3-methyladenine DNA glycosylase/8-oxoguanine DNA glycosylase
MATSGLALDFDPKRAVRALRRGDPGLAEVFDAIGPCRLADEMRQSDSVFPTLVEAIVAQQLSAKAAATIHGRLCALFSGRRGERSTPTPRQIARASEEKLRSAGLSRAKALAVGDLARRTLSGEIPPLEIIRTLPDDEIVARLTSVRGIGRWTAEMFLIFRLGRPDVLPVDDYALRKGFSIATGLAEMPSPRVVASHGERWAPWRTVASWYLWRLAERGQLED